MRADVAGDVGELLMQLRTCAHPLLMFSSTVLKQAVSNGALSDSIASGWLLHVQQIHSCTLQQRSVQTQQFLEASGSFPDKHAWDVATGVIEGFAAAAEKLLEALCLSTFAEDESPAAVQGGGGVLGMLAPRGEFLVVPMDGAIHQGQPPVPPSTSSNTMCALIAVHRAPRLACPSEIRSIYAALREPVVLLTRHVGGCSAAMHAMCLEWYDPCLLCKSLVDTRVIDSPSTAGGASMPLQELAVADVPRMTAKEIEETALSKQSMGIDWAVPGETSSGAVVGEFLYGCSSCLQHGVVR